MTFPRAKTPVTAAVALLSTIVLLASCAVSQGSFPSLPPETARAASPDPDRLPAADNPVSTMKSARLEVNAVGDGYQQGQRYFGINTRFSLVLIFAQPLVPKVDPQRFFARIGTLEFPFTRSNGSHEYFTEQLELSAPDLEFGPVAVTAFYRDPGGGEISLCSADRVVVDTTPPLPPDLRIAGCSPAYYTLHWTPTDPVNGLEYGVQTLQGGTWVKLPPGSVGSPPVRIDRQISGRARVVAMDPAGNRAVSGEVILECAPLAVTDMKILAPTHTLSRINDRVITGQDALSAAYAVEVTANRHGKLMLVNVDAGGYGYRLFPTTCRTGKEFDGQLGPAEPKRYPINREDGYYYLGLDEQTGLEEIYAIIYGEEEIRDRVWEWVQNEICETLPHGERTETALPKGTRELPGIHHSNGKRQVVEFERKLDGLQKAYGNQVIWTKRSFWHR